ncbi:hypothetical protein EMIT0P44_70144 [Pseudomonas sp. IT-P44]
MSRFDEPVYYIVLVDAFVTLDFREHPLCDCLGVHHLASGTMRSNDSGGNRPLSSFFPANHWHL